MAFTSPTTTDRKLSTVSFSDVHPPSAVCLRRVGGGRRSSRAVVLLHHRNALGAVRVALQCMIVTVV